MRAAGTLIVAKNGLALFLKRGMSCDHPAEWCFPGGGLEDDETPEAGAIRETLEETGYSPERLTLLARSSGPDPANVTGDPAAPAGVDFTTFLHPIEEPFLPVLCDESIGFAWAPLESPPEPLHPGCRGALVRVYGNELDIARAMAAGDLASPQVYRNVHLWNLRLTGTGISYRPSIDEYVLRDPEVYLNDDFLARCNGLAAIAYHPDTGHLTSEEFAKRTVGSVFYPYIKGDEVWGVTKVYDDEMNRLMREEPASTSPMVIVSSSDSLKLTTEDGRKMLIEGEPVLLDHIALLPKSTLGVWDKGGPAAGVDRSGLESAELALADSLESLELSAKLLDLRFSVAAPRARGWDGKDTTLRAGD